MGTSYHASRRIDAPPEVVWRLLTDASTYLVEPREGVTHFEMTETYTGLLAGLFTKAIPDLSPSFNLFADSLKAAAEAQT
jgi:hypothetical protein